MNTDFLPRMVTNDRECNQTGQGEWSFPLASRHSDITRFQGKTANNDEGIFMRRSLFSFHLTMLMLLLGGMVFAQPVEKMSERLRRAIALVEPGESQAAWVYFRDKGPGLLRKQADVAAQLNERAYQRRLRERGVAHLVDEHDLPLRGEYVREVRVLAETLRVKSRWLNAVSLEASPAALAAIAEMPFVARVDLVRRGRAPLPEPAAPALLRGGTAATTLDYGPSFDQNSQINTPPLHDLGYSGAGVLIASLDTGFPNLAHEALAHLDIVATWDFINGDSIVDNQSGQAGNDDHGTNTLGAMGGYMPGQLIGSAYGASFLLAKTEVVEFERHIEEDHWVAAAEWADSLGADIISSSLGYRFFDPGEGDYSAGDLDGQTAVITVAAELASSRGIQVVVSAGNEGAGVTTIGAPADGPSVLAVGAVNSSGGVVSFSSRGPTADGRIKPDIAARGLGVRTVSAVANNYASLSGTSFSCPLAAGVVALLREASPQSTNSELRAALKETAGNAQSPDNNLGWGIIDAARALEYLENGGQLPPAGDKLKILKNFPNPFDGNTTIRYTVPRDSRVKLTVYNVLGEKVAVLLDARQAAGTWAVRWDAEGLAQGVYFVMLSANGETDAHKLVYLRQE